MDRTACVRLYQISIHALREEGDCPVWQDGRADPISIHALREEGDAASAVTTRPTTIFLSTPSARRATPAGRAGGKMGKNFYPRPPRGGRREFLRSCAGSWRFLSTPSARRATGRSPTHQPPKKISIHALREEGDRPGRTAAGPGRDFYPRPPRGGRLGRRSCNAATKSISIHALREEGDSKNRDKISIFKQIIQHSARI